MTLPILLKMWVIFQIPCGNCGGKSDNGTHLSPSTSDISLSKSFSPCSMFMHSSPTAAKLRRGNVASGTAARSPEFKVP